MRKIQLTNYVVRICDTKEDIVKAISNEYPSYITKSVLGSVNIVGVVIFESQLTHARHMVFKVYNPSSDEMVYHQYFHLWNPSDELFTEYYQKVRDCNLIEEALSYLKLDSNWYYASLRDVRKITITDVNLSIAENNVILKVLYRKDSNPWTYCIPVGIKTFINSVDDTGGRVLSDLNGSAICYYESFEKVRDIVMSRLRESFKSVHDDLLCIKQKMAEIKNIKKEDL